MALFRMMSTAKRFGAGKSASARITLREGDDARMTRLRDDTLKRSRLKKTRKAGYGEYSAKFCIKPLLIWFSNIK